MYQPEKTEEKIMKGLSRSYMIYSSTEVLRAYNTVVDMLLLTEQTDKYECLDP